MDNDKYKSITDAISSFCAVSEPEMAEIIKLFTVAYLKKKRILFERRTSM